ncbi:membrane protein, partial [human gut metagenome]
LLQFGPLTITLKPLIAVTLLGFALCLAVLALRKKPLVVLAGPALVWVLSLAAPVSWMVLSKAHAYVHVHLVPMLWHFALVPVSCALLVWLVKTAITAVKIIGIPPPGLRTGGVCITIKGSNAFLIEQQRGNLPCGIPSNIIKPSITTKCWSCRGVSAAGCTGRG